MIYLIIFLLLFILSYRYDYCQRKRHFAVWCGVAFFVLVGLVGLRYRIGVDSIRYESFYRIVSDVGHFKWMELESTRFEPLFYLFCVLCKTVSKDFTFMQVMHALIVNGVVFWFFYKNTRHFFTALFIYYIMLYIPLNTEVLREALAICCFLLAWPSFVKGRWWLYYILAFVGTGFHSGAYIMMVLPILWLPGIRKIFTFGRRTLISCAVLLVLGFVMNASFFNIFRMIEFSDNISTLAEKYSATELAGSLYNVYGAILLIVKFVVYPYFALWLLSRSTKRQERLVNETGDKKAIKEFGERKKYLQKVEFMAMMSIYVSVLNIPIGILYRFNNYFLFFGILAIAMVMYEPIVTKHHKLIRLTFGKWFIAILPMLLIAINGLILGKANDSGTLRQYMRIYPYSWRLDPKDDADREALYRYYRAW